MKALKIAVKSLREQLRDPMWLLLTLVFGPLFVIMYALFFPSGSTTFAILVENRDVPAATADGTTIRGGDDLVLALQAVKYQNGNPLLNVSTVADHATGEAALRDRKALVLVVVPAGFSASVAAAQADPAAVVDPPTLMGDLTNPAYAPAAVMANATIEGYAQIATRRSPAVTVTEQPLGASAMRTEFETYVPGLLVFSVMMLLFTASMLITREVETGTLRRLRMTRLRASEYLAGLTVSLSLVALASLLLTFATALALGFRSQGSVWLAVVVVMLSALSIIGVGLLMSAFCRNVMQTFMLANFPLALFMFFSGSIYPIPRTTLFAIAGHDIALFDWMPATQAVVALNKVMTLGAGVGEIAWELGALAALSALYFGVGLVAFQRRQYRLE